MKTIIINGRAIQDIPSFYREINRAFMPGETWQLGDSLDAFDDLLYGSYGAIAGRERVRIVWQDFDQSKAALGYETTRQFLLSKLEKPATYNVGVIRDQLDALEEGRGQTYVQIVLTIFADHENITLELR
ncbi:MAG: ribonuclease inhibitor [Sphingomonas sp.]|nr:MAG: ribonuclease inhibitor [Sphingomonas sp.]